MSQRDLVDYGIVSPPSIRKHRGGPGPRVFLGDTPVGWYGRDTDTGKKVYVTQRDRRRGHVHDSMNTRGSPPGGYTISTELLDQFQQVGIHTIYILEQPSGDVLRFATRQFFGPDSAAVEWGDPQRAAAIEDADRWDDHVEDFWNPHPTVNDVWQRKQERTGGQ